jgi:integrase
VTVSEVRQDLAEGRIRLPKTGAVIEGPHVGLPYVVCDGDMFEVEPVSEYLRELMLNDNRPATCASYAKDLLRWFRMLWLIDLAWDKATGIEARLLVAHLRVAENPQRRRHSRDSPPPGSVNLRTGKPSLRRGYAPRTINHQLSVLSSFYAFHGRFGRGPVLNPVPESTSRRGAVAHRSPIEPKPMMQRLRDGTEAGPRIRRAELRQKVPKHAPRAIPNPMWDELFGAMTCNRDRALLSFYVSCGARASELLGLVMRNVDWAGKRIYVVSKGGDELEPVPASPESFLYLTLYLDDYGVPDPDDVVWRTIHGPEKPLSYSAMRRVLQRANAKLGTNYTLHDLRHTACSRMSQDGRMSLTDIQTIMRHADPNTTQIYMPTPVEELFNKLQEFYTSPRPERTYAAGYDPEDIKAVFGA